MPTTLLWSAVIASGMVVFLWAIAGSRKERTPRTVGATADLRAIEMQRGVGTRAVTPTLRWFSLRARRFTPIGLIEFLDRQITLAGVREKFPLERALATKFMATLLGIAVAIFTWRVLDFRVTAVALAILGYFLVDLLLWSRGRERQKTIEKELPDTMDQLTISVESGLAFEGALERASRRDGPLAYEIGRTLGEIQLGSSRREAMLSMVDRTEVGDLRRFVAAMIHAEAFGVPIASVLRAQAADLRDKRRQRAQEKAQRIPILLIFPLIFFIFPSIFVILLGPASIRILEEVLGIPVP
jgi:tight adherence protein C